MTVELFDVVSFILMVALPAFCISIFSLFLARSVKKDVPTIVIFPLSVIFLSIFANNLWDKYVFNSFYHEWDRIFIPYSLISHESPLMDGTGSWYAHGWDKTGLDLVWFSMTIIIYTLASIISILFGLIHKNSLLETIKSSLMCFFVGSVVTIVLLLLKLV